MKVMDQNELMLAELLELRRQHRALDEEIAKLTEQVPEEAKKGRKDLRELPLVTIDGEDARDFDDAVYCQPKRSGGWRLWVAIADVSYYVRPGTALDNEGYQRGNSVYFPEQVIPMLPEVLSNGLCSLNPQVDRLCMVAEITISATGKQSGFKFYEAVMRSAARLTYTRAMRILDGQGLSAEETGLRKLLLPLQDLHRAFAKARAERGAIDFGLSETVIELDDQGDVAAIRGTTASREMRATWDGRRGPSFAGVFMGQSGVLRWPVT